MEADQSAREQQGYGDALTQALTLVVGPVLFGFVGWLVDRWLGTSPVFMLAFGLFGLAGAVITSYFEFAERMRRHDEGKPWTRRLR